MSTPLRALILEDRPSDVELMLRELRRSGFEPQYSVVASREAYVAQLSPALDIILADFNLPQFDAIQALVEARRADVGVPVIVVTGSLSDEDAVRCMKEGAADYLLKDRLARLGQAVEHAIAVNELGKEQRRAQAAEEESRRRLSAIFESSHEAFLLAAPDGSIIDANPAAEELTGFTPAELQGRAVWDLATPETRDRERAAWSALHSEGQSKGEQEIVRTDGSTRAVEYQAVASITPGVHLSVLRDVTDRRKTEEALANAQRLESLAVLAGGVAHDFNNLLVAVLGNADLAIDSLPPESPAQDPIRQIKMAARRAADLARQMLAMSGRGKFVIETIDVNQLVEEMTHLLKASMSKGAVLKYNLTPAVPVIEADGTQIRQIVMNLVVNASDAIGSGDGVVTISTGSMNADRAFLSEAFLAPELPVGQYVFFEVADTGVGMDAATRKRIFDPFFTTKFTGRGLGLAAVLGVVQAHHGAIRVYSEPGRGTTFKVLLPALPDAHALKANTVAAEAVWTRSGTILLADDEPSVRSLLVRALERLGFTVIVAEDGQEAVDRFRESMGDISAVMLDMTMPRLNGDGALREIRRLDPAARVIIMSGYNEQDTTARVAGKAISGFLQKPFELRTLKNVLRRVLEAPQSP